MFNVFYLFGSFWSYFCVLLGEKFKKVFARMSQLASSGATELRVRSLDAISQILTLQVKRHSHRQIFEGKSFSGF